MFFLSFQSLRLFFLYLILIAWFSFCFRTNLEFIVPLTFFPNVLAPSPLPTWYTFHSRKGKEVIALHSFKSLDITFLFSQLDILPHKLEFYTTLFCLEVTGAACWVHLSVGPPVSETKRTWAKGKEKQMYFFFRSMPTSSTKSAFSAEF